MAQALWCCNFVLCRFFSLYSHLKSSLSCVFKINYVINKGVLWGNNGGRGYKGGASLVDSTEFHQIIRENGEIFHETIHIFDISKAARKCNCCLSLESLASGKSYIPQALTTNWVQKMSISSKTLNADSKQVCNSLAFAKSLSILSIFCYMGDQMGGCRLEAKSKSALSKMVCHMLLQNKSMSQSPPSSLTFVLSISLGFLMTTL